MIVAVASGKGGTGKTTVAVNLACVWHGPVQLVDCDVEEPNCHLFLGGKLRLHTRVAIPVLEVDELRCTGCGQCVRSCQYHALALVGSKPLLFAELCHGCGGCARVCRPEAIREVDREVGALEIRESGAITLLQGRLDVGQAMAPPVIRALKARIDARLPAILDAPPGASCPVVTTLRAADFVILVSEPTPFGLHDLALAVEVTRSLGIPFGLVLNRAGLGDHRLHQYCCKDRIPILLEIPDDRRIAEAYSRGALLVNAFPEYRAGFERLRDAVWDSCHAVAAR